MNVPMETHVKMWLTQHARTQREGSHVSVLQDLFSMRVYVRVSPHEFSVWF